MDMRSLIVLIGYSLICGCRRDLTVIAIDDTTLKPVTGAKLIYQAGLNDDLAWLIHGGDDIRFRSVGLTNNSGIIKARSLRTGWTYEFMLGHAGYEPTGFSLSDEVGFQVYVKPITCEPYKKSKIYIIPMHRDDAPYQDNDVQQDIFKDFEQRANSTPAP